MGGLFSSSFSASPTGMPSANLHLLPYTFIDSDTPGRIWLCVGGSQGVPPPPGSPKLTHSC